MFLEVHYIILAVLSRLHLTQALDSFSFVWSSSRLLLMLFDSFPQATTLITESVNWCGLEVQNEFLQAVGSQHP